MKRFAFILILIALMLLPVNAEENNNRIYYWNFNGHGREASVDSMDMTDYDTFQYTDGKLGKALDLSAGDAYGLTDSANCVFDQFTVAAWVYIDEDVPSSANFQIVFAKDAKSVGHFELFFMMAGEQYQVRIYSYDLGEAIGIEQLVDKGTWLHIAATFDGKYQKLYLNGQEAFSQEYSATLDTSTEEYMMAIGGLVETGFPFYGLIDELVVANYAFEADKIAALCDNPETAANNLMETIKASYPEGKTPRPDITPTPEPTEVPTQAPTPNKTSIPVATQKPNVETDDNNTLVITGIIAATVIVAIIVVIIIIPKKKKQ